MNLATNPHPPYFTSIGVLLLVVVLLSSCSTDQPELPYFEGQRIIQPINQHWRFVLSEPKAIASVADEKWKDVVLPHTWNNRDGQDGGDDYYRGTGIYRRNLELDERYWDKKLYLHFDGATISSRVYVNGMLAGSHKGSYGAFRFDISELVHIGESNLIEVHVSNVSDDRVAPLSADFTFFGGLYRGARLIATEPVHIETMNYASNGVFWTQDKITKHRAELTVRTALLNELAQSETVTISAQLSDGEGTVVASSKQELKLSPGEAAPIKLNLALDNPRLWHGRKDPYLYQASVMVSRDDGTLDSITEPLGLRFFHVDPDKGFFLNGESYPLHGVNL